MNEQEADALLISRPLETLGTSAGWLRARLVAESVRVHPSCRLMVALKTLDELRAKALSGETFEFATMETAYGFVGDAVGADFLSKALHAGWEAGLRLPKARWQDLTSGDPIVTKQGHGSKARNLTWEVLIASLAATFAKDVSFNEPDVVCTFEGESFAIAAKVAYSKDQLFENVECGFRQANGKANASLVFVDVVGVYPVVENLRLSCCRASSDHEKELVGMVESFNRWCGTFAVADTIKMLKDRAKHPVGVAFFVPMFLHVQGAPRPFFYTHLPIQWSRTGPDYEFAKAFLGACNSVLGFVPQGEARMI